MVDIARVRYEFNVQQLFEVTSTTQITEQEQRDNDGQVVRQEYQWIRENLQRLRGRENGEKRILTLIVNLGNVHWVTLVIIYQDENYYGYYANSTSGDIPNDIRQALESGGVNNANIHNVLAGQEGNLLIQQRDGYNCGLWALENARDINQVLRRNNNLRDQQYFQDLRRDISVQLREYAQRLDNLARFGIGGVHQGNEQHHEGNAPILPNLGNFQSTYSSQQQEINVQAANDDQPSSKLSGVQANVANQFKSRRHSI